MKKIEIYIHIPFCVKKCDYCDFLSAPSDNKIRAKYIEALKNEIRANKERMRQFAVDTIFFGGGTPSILEVEQIVSIMDVLRENAKILDSAEITIECNPGTVTEEKLLAYKNAGINRLSFGLQSANDNELKSIGRIHNYAQFLESYNLARKCGFSNINVDLMSALPGQSESSYRDTLEKIIELNPEHISAYSLIVEEGTKMYDRVKKAKFNGNTILPDEDEERKMYYMTKLLLANAGYDRYEISNYAKTGYECRHNIGYWKRKDYLGFGIGAASLYKEERYSNISDINLYTEELSKDNCSLSNIQENTNKLSKQEQMEEFMFLGLRMMEGVSVNKFEEVFRESYEEVYGEVSEKLIKQELLEKEGDNIRLTEHGIDVSNYVMSEFLL